MYFNRSDYSVPILITLITMEEGSDKLLNEVKDEFGKVLLEFDVIAPTVTVNRFGE